jgi:hypothetical protein
MILMRWMFFISFVALTAMACKKDKSDQPFSAFAENGPFAGVWVETSQNKDTLNFNIPMQWLEQLPWQPPSNAGVFFMGSETYKDYDGSINSPGGVFAYYRNAAGDSLNIYNYFVSSKYEQFSFSLDQSLGLFKIAKFYKRPGLPDNIMFRRIR